MRVCVYACMRVCMYACIDGRALVLEKVNSRGLVDLVSRIRNCGLLSLRISFESYFRVSLVFESHQESKLTLKLKLKWTLKLNLDLKSEVKLKMKMNEKTEGKKKRMVVIRCHLNQTQTQTQKKRKIKETKIGPRRLES